MFLNLLISELEKYKWNIEHKITSNDPFYYIIFKESVISFYRNHQYSSVECFIRQKKDNHSDISLAEVLEFNGFDFPDLYWDQSSVSEKEYLVQYIKIIYEKLLNIINGDIESLRKIELRHSNIGKIQDALNTAFVFDSLVYKKMMSGDESWEFDLKNI